MEVSGKIKAKQTFSASCGSDEDFLLFCIPCDRDGSRVQAKGYCSTCNEHLCGICYRHHKKQTPSRNHTLLDQDSMPTTPSGTLQQDELNCCDDHQDEKLKLYCFDHDIVACSICLALNHRLCKVEYIPKLSKHILKNKELDEVMTQMKTQEASCKSKIQKTKDAIKVITQSHDEIIQAIHEFRKEINARLDEMEICVVKEAESMLVKQQTTLKSMTKDEEDIKEEMMNKQECLNNLRQRNCLDKLFIETKAAKKRLRELKAKEKQHDRMNDLHLKRFVKNKALLDMFESHELGEFTLIKTENVRAIKGISTPSEDETLNLEVVEDINVVSTSDKKECSLTGIEVIKPDTIVVCDWNNHKVKCYDTLQRRVISEIKLKSPPYDIAAITDDKSVVTLPYKKSINFMSLANQQITSERMVNINVEGYGIAYGRNNLVVSSYYRPGKVFVLDLQGSLLKNIGGDDSLLSCPRYISINMAGTAIYVSNCGYPVNAVKQLDWHGNVSNTYDPGQDRGQYLQGICELNDGSFLICFCSDSEDNLLRISNDCKPCKLKKTDKLESWYPKVAAFCESTRNLYVSYSETGRNKPYSMIKVFKMDWC